MDSDISARHYYLVKLKATGPLAQDFTCNATDCAWSELVVVFIILAIIIEA